MNDRIAIEDEKGEVQLVSYDELDEGIFPELWKPTGKFTYSANALLQLKLPETPYYIKEWLPLQGKMCFYGQEKVGKSFLAVQLARHIAYEEPIFRHATKGGRVFYLQSELAPSVVQYRMKSTGQEYDEVFVGTTFSLKLDSKEGQKVLLEELDAVRPNVLIIDPLYKMMEGDENEVQSMMLVLNFFDVTMEYHKEDNLSIILFHHAGKDLTKGARGSSCLAGWVDSYIEMKKTSSERGQLKAKLTPKALRHAALPPEPIDIMLGEDFEFHGTAPNKTIKDKICEHLAVKGACTINELIEAGLGSRRSIYNARKELLDGDKIIMLGGGQYKLCGGQEIQTKE